MNTLPSTYHTSCLPAQLHLVPALTGGRPCEELEQSTAYSSVLGQ